MDIGAADTTRPARGPGLQNNAVGGALSGNGSCRPGSREGCVLALARMRPRVAHSLESTADAGAVARVHGMGRSPGFEQALSGPPRLCQFFSTFQNTGTPGAPECRRYSCGPAPPDTTARDGGTASI